MFTLGFSFGTRGLPTAAVSLVTNSRGGKEDFFVMCLQQKQQGPACSTGPEIKSADCLEQKKRQPAGVSVTGCCKRNSSSASLGTFTCGPLAMICTPAPAPPPAAAPIAAPLPPAAMPPMIAPRIAPPPTFLAVSPPRPLPCTL